MLQRADRFCPAILVWGNPKIQKNSTFEKVGFFAVNQVYYLVGALQRQEEKRSLGALEPDYEIHYFTAAMRISWENIKNSVIGLEKSEFSLWFGRDTKYDATSLFLTILRADQLRPAILMWGIMKI